MRKHKVVFYSPSSLFSESSKYDIDDWNISKAISLSEEECALGAKPYEFYFETFLTSKDSPDGEGGFLKIQPRSVEKSSMHFLGGTIETYDNVDCVR